MKPYLIFSLFIAFNAFGQYRDESMTSSYTKEEIDSITNARTSFMVKYAGDSVVLRWMPVDHNHWLLSRSSGFLLVRGTFDNNHKVVRWDTLNHQRPIVRWSKIDIENYFKSTRDTIAYASKALLYKKNSDPLERPENFSDIIHQREGHGMTHLMAILLSSQSPQAANMMGLRYVDKGLDKKYTYGYYLHSLVDTNMFHHVDAAVLVDINKPATKYQMPEITAVGAEKTILLRWDKSTSLGQFIVYYAERSVDGHKWYRLNKEPYFPSADEDNQGICTYFEYKDSVEVNYKPYFYRMIGIDDFGDASISNVVKGYGVDQTPPDAVSDTKIENTKGTSVRLTWAKKKKESDFAGYIVGKSKNVDGPFEPINQSLLPPSTTTFTDDNADPHGFNYYVIAAVDTASNASMQMPILAVMKDDIPPLKPTHLQYTIDTAGAIHITWDAYNAPDFDGYLVLSANQRNHEFTPVSHGRLMEAHFRDTILIKTLTKHIYYKVITFDKHNNASEYSDVLEVRKPDVVAPVEPIISNYHVGLGKVSIEWNPSSSTDVKSQAIFRKISGSQSDYLWLCNLDRDITKYVDSEVAQGKSYDYVLQAIDSSGIKSSFSHPLHVHVYNQSQLPKITNLTVDKDKQTGHLTIRWDYTYNANNLKYILYKGSDAKVEQYKYTKEPKFIDSAYLNSDLIYYAVKAITDDGAESPLSDSVVMKIK